MNGKITMEKYTNLEQAIQDPSLVIITENITTQKELNKVYVKYKSFQKSRNDIPTITQTNS